MVEMYEVRSTDKLLLDYCTFKVKLAAHRSNGLRVISGVKQVALFVTYIYIKASSSKTPKRITQHIMGFSILPTKLGTYYSRDCSKRLPNNQSVLTGTRGVLQPSYVEGRFRGWSHRFLTIILMVGKFFHQPPPDYRHIQP